MTRSPLPQTKLRSLIARLALVLLGSTGALSATELFIRTDFSRRHVLGPFRDPEALYAPLHRNAAGFRDEEHAVERTPETETRILILGDSLTYGQGVIYSQIYPTLLREKVDASTEIIVAAHQGASTLQELALLERYGCQYSPDVVLVGVVTNDPQGVDEAPRQQPQWDLFSRRLNGLHLPKLLSYFANRLGDHYGWRYSYNQWEADVFREDVVTAWGGVVKDLAHRSRECGATRLYAFTLPGLADYSDPNILQRYRFKHATMAATFQQAKFETVNLFAAYLAEFGDRPARSLRPCPRNGHPGPEVHAWYAEQIWTYLWDDL